jgi:hypothetical protein
MKILLVDDDDGLRSFLAKELEARSYEANAPDHGFQTDPTFFPFVVDLLPLRKVFPTCRDATNPAFRAVRQDDHAVEPKDLRDRGAIVREVEIEGVL